jgi:hypothetical protein
MPLKGHQCSVGTRMCYYRLLSTCESVLAENSLPIPNIFPPHAHDRRFSSGIKPKEASRNAVNGFWAHVVDLGSHLLGVHFTTVNKNLHNDILVIKIDTNY